MFKAGGKDAYYLMLLMISLSIQLIGLFWGNIAEYTRYNTMFVLFSIIITCGAYALIGYTGNRPKKIKAPKPSKSDDAFVDLKGR